MPSGRPNIVLCICDQLRAFETGCYGNRIIRTPAIDRLAADGVLFETAVTNYPMCMAARSVLLSGQYNRSCTGGVANVAWPGRPGDFLLPEYPFAGRPHLPATTLPEALRAAGYRTGVIGKWHIHSWPDEVGFDEYLIPRVHHAHSGQLYCENGGPEFAASGWSVDFEAERVERYLEARGRGAEQPFFLYYSISPPHNPLADAPEEYLRMYDPVDIALRPNVRLDVPLKDQDYWFKVYRWDYRYYSYDLPSTRNLPDGYDLRRMIAEYYGLTTWMDRAVGRMLAALERAGLADDTIVIFTSDHGDNLGSHGLVQKGTPNEEAVRIPLVARWPGHLPAGRRVDDAVAGLVDLAPSLFGLAGLPGQGHFQGRDLFAERQLPRQAFIETPGGAGVRTCDRLYFVPYAGGGDDPMSMSAGQVQPRALADRPGMHYDCRRDPYQLHNLAGQGEAAGAARPGDEQAAVELDRLLRDWDAATEWMK